MKGEERDDAAVSRLFQFIIGRTRSELVLEIISRSRVRWKCDIEINHEHDIQETVNFPTRQSGQPGLRRMSPGPKHRISSIKGAVSEGGCGFLSAFYVMDETSAGCSLVYSGLWALGSGLCRLAVGVEVGGWE